MTVRRHFIAAFCALLGAEALPGSVIYVDTQLPVASCTDYNPISRNRSGSAIAYQTIAAAAFVAQPGDTVEIRGGAYDEQLRPARSGNAEAPIEFRGTAGENVYLNGSPGILLSDRSHITIANVRVEDRHWLEAANTHHCSILNSTFLRTPASGTTGNIRFIASTYNRIVGCRIEDGQDNITIIDSNYNLIEGNTVQEGRHSLFSIRCGDYNVIRNNFFANSKQKCGEVYDCGEDTSAVPNSFDSTSHNVIEWNTFADASTYYSTSAGNGIQYAGQDGIIRFNVFFNCNVGVGMQRYSDEALHNEDNRVYHNVFYRNDGAGIALSANTSGNVFTNNILLGNQGCNSDCNAVSPGQIVYRSPIGSTIRFQRNAILYQQPGQAVIEPLFSSGSTIASFSSANPGIVSESLEVDPQFVDAVSHDFHLKSTSALIDAGAFLTSTSGSGSGRSLTVADSRCFRTNFGIAGLPADVIQLQGQTVTARVLGVDYTANTVTVDRDMTWASGLGISLAFSGATPDVGAFEYESTANTPTAPSNLTTAPGP